MGVYVFGCGTSGWIKVGHFQPRRGGARKARVSLDNPWFRVARRGFRSLKHPQELDALLDACDLQLLAWYPTLDRRAEAAIHRQFSEGAVGEFHRQSQLEEVLAACDARGLRESVDETARARAMAWAGRPHEAGVSR